MFLSFPARHVRRDAFCGGRASSPSVGMQLSAIGFQLFSSASNEVGFPKKEAES